MTTTEAALRDALEQAIQLLYDHVGGHGGIEELERALSQPSPASSTAGEDGSLALGLRQAQYALKDYHQKQPDCAFDKLAKICGEAADLLSPSSGEPAFSQSPPENVSKAATTPENAQPASVAVQCVACEDKPAAENDPCAVCGRSSKPTPVEAGALERVTLVLAIDEYADRHSIAPEAENIVGTDHFDRWLTHARPSFERTARAILAALREPKESGDGHD